MDGGLQHCTEGGNQNHLKKKKCKKAKWLSEEALQRAVKSERQRRKERYTHLNTEFQRIARKDFKKQRNRGRQ